MGFRVTWNDNNVAEEGHHIYRSQTSMAGLDVSQLPPPYATVGPDVTEYEDGEVTPGETYFYRIGAFTASGAVVLVSDEYEALAEEGVMPTAGLVFHCDMKGVTGGVVPELVGGLDGTIIGGVTPVVDAYGAGVECDGSSGYVNFGTILPFLHRGDDFTVHVAFQLLDLSRRNLEFVLGSTITNSSPGIAMFYDDRRISGSNLAVTTRRMRTMLVGYDGGEGQSPTYEQPDASGLVRLGFRKQGSTIDFMQDGVVMASLSGDRFSGTENADYPLTMGAWTGNLGATYARVRVYSIRVYQAGLSDQAMATLATEDYS